MSGEAERIKKCKGRVFALQDEPEVPRVWLPFDDAPGLAMARAFGDFCLKDYGVISVPEFFHWSLTEKDQFVILASDGVHIFSSCLAVPLCFGFWIKLPLQRYDFKNICVASYALYLFHQNMISCNVMSICRTFAFCDLSSRTWWGFSFQDVSCVSLKLKENS